MNRMGLGLAVGAGYLLGRTRKMKLAFALGTLAAGKRLPLSPGALAEVVSHQLRENPQFKEIGDQLREDLRGVGKAASGAMVERQMDALADRLHGRTSEVRDQLESVTGLAGPEGSADEDDGREDSESEEDETRQGADGEPSGESRRASKGSARKAADRSPAGKATTKASAKKAPAKKAAAKRTTTARKKTSAGGSAARGGRNRLPKGGEES
ncbi:DNA primase [Streptomyces sp. NPDC005209]|uniref:DNA primase n=1 Tax=Streptomyces sp. NPDC005209 TaxID=3156715 RepID=UPI0033A13052